MKKLDLAWKQTSVIRPMAIEHHYVMTGHVVCNNSAALAQNAVAH